MSPPNRFSSGILSWMVTLLLPLRQVVPGDEEEQDALVACHCPGSEYDLIHPISLHLSFWLL